MTYRCCFISIPVAKNDIFQSDNSPFTHYPQDMLLSLITHSFLVFHAARIFKQFKGVLICFLNRWEVHLATDFDFSLFHKVNILYRVSLSVKDIGLDPVHLERVRQKQVQFWPRHAHRIESRNLPQERKFFIQGFLLLRQNHFLEVSFVNLQDKRFLNRDRTVKPRFAL